MYFNQIKPDLFDNSAITSDTTLPIWNSPESYNKVIEHVDSHLKIFDGQYRIYTESLSFHELLLSLDLANLIALKKLSTKYVQLKTLIELQNHQVQGKKLYSPFFNDQYQHLEILNLKWHGDNPPSFYRMSDGLEIVDWFYDQVVAAFYDEPYIKDVNTAGDLLGEYYWSLLNEEERLTTTSILLNLIEDDDDFMIRRVKTDDESQILFERTPAFYGEDE